MSLVDSFRSGFDQPEALEYLAELVPLVYKSSSGKASKSLPLANFHQMIMSHSKFLGTLLASVPASCETPSSTMDTDTAAAAATGQSADDQLKTKRKSKVLLRCASNKLMSQACNALDIPSMVCSVSL